MITTVDADTLWAIVPKVGGARGVRQQAIIEGIGPLIPAELEAYQVNTPFRVANFLGQCAEESDAFCTLEEYASGSAYQGRVDLGNTKPGYGVKYKGRGLIEVTGFVNYERIGGELNLDLVDNPTILSTDYKAALDSALIYWRDHGLNTLADRDDERGITKAVNGGLNGLATRLQYTARAKAALRALPATPAQTPRVLGTGDTGEDVADVQRLLVAWGYPLTIDGDFGPATEMAVAHFQSIHKVGSDGVVDNATMNALEKLAQG
jgi:putative chitinase